MENTIENKKNNRKTQSRKEQNRLEQVGQVAGW